MSQNDSVNPFIMEIFLHGNFSFFRGEEKDTLMENMFFFLERIENSMCGNEIFQELFLLARGLILSLET